MGAPPASAAAPTIQLSAGAVPVGGLVVVSGIAPRGRAVSLQQLRAGRWEPLGTTTASSRGSYRFVAPAWWLGRRQVRVWTPSRFMSPGGYSPTVAYDVVPRYRPSGDPSRYALTFPGYRWDPCRTIGWKFNANGGDLRLLPVVARAFGALSSATGLHFAYRGSTTLVGGRDRASRAGTDILVSWASPREVAELSGNNVGVTHTVISSTTSEHAGASVALDRTARLRFGARPSERPTWRQVALHELAHAVGLTHSSGRRQVLFHKVHGDNHRFGAGDLAGLRAVGAENPCLRAG